MQTRFAVLIVGTITSLATLAVLSPMLVFPGSAPIKQTVACGTGLDLIKELERYGYVKIIYDDYVPYHERNQGKWKASFFSPYDIGVPHIEFSSRKPTLCDALDTLYYAVMEHPMKPINE